MGPVITDLFRRRAEGARFAELRAYLEAEGIAPPRSGRWRRETLNGSFRNRVYLGEVGYGEFSKAGAHRALTDLATWTSAQHPTHPQPHPRVAEPALLRGLLRCAGCRRVMTTCRIRLGGGRALTYRCDTDHPSCPVRAPRGW